MVRAVRSQPPGCSHARVSLQHLRPGEDDFQNDEESKEEGYLRTLINLEIWLLGWRMPKMAVAVVFPLIFWIFGARGLIITLMSYMLYTAMIWSSGDFAPTTWNANAERELQETMREREQMR